MKGLDVSNITLSDFILDCSTKFSRDSQLSSSADRLEIYYKPTDGQWRQLFGDDDLRCLLQTMKTDVLDLKLEVSKRDLFSTYKSIDDVLDKFNIVGGLGSLPGFRPEIIDIKKDDPHFEHCIENLKEKLRAFGDARKNEAYAREFISPVLIAAVLLVPDRADTRLDIETSVIGEDDGGHVDSSILKGNELVCISEAKNAI
jgi:hypothetical protein